MMTVEDAHHRSHSQVRAGLEPCPEHVTYVMCKFSLIGGYQPEYHPGSAGPFKDRIERVHRSTFMMCKRTTTFDFWPRLRNKTVPRTLEKTES